jgi:myosin heavy subunit
MYRLQRLREVDVQSLLDRAADLHAALAATARVYTSCREAAAVLTSARARVVASARRTRLNPHVVVLAMGSRLELSQDALLDHSKQAVVPVARVNNVNAQLRERASSLRQLLQQLHSNRHLTLQRARESRYVSLSILDVGDVAAELQLLHLTKSLQARIVAGGAAADHGQVEAKLQEQIQFVRQHTGETLLALKDRLDAAQQRAADRRAENQALREAVSSLQASLEQTQGIAQGARESAARSRLESRGGSAGEGMSVKTRKLEQALAVQRKEIAALSAEVKRWRDRTFPALPALMGRPVSSSRQAVRVEREAETPVLPSIFRNRK